MTSPLPFSALKFDYEFEKKEQREHVFDNRTYPPDTRLEKNVWLYYFVDDDGKRKNLVDIYLRDTDGFDKKMFGRGLEGKIRYWFNYAPAKKTKLGEQEIVTAPIIYLVVFSSVYVSVDRHTDNIKKYKERGFLGDIVGSRHEDVGPANPKIILQRVHQLSQIPKLSDTNRVAELKSSYSFYATGEGHEVITQAESFEKLPQKDKDKLQGMRGAKSRTTWTRVSFDHTYTKFFFPETAFELKVFDQFFDTVNRKDVLFNQKEAEGNKILLSEALEVQHKAKTLQSYPKWLRYKVGAAYKPVYRPTLELEVSQRMQLQGTHLEDLKHVGLVAAYTLSRRPDVTIYDLQIGMAGSLEQGKILLRYAYTMMDVTIGGVTSRRNMKKPTREDIETWKEAVKASQRGSVSLTESYPPYYSYEKGTITLLSEAALSITVGFIPGLGDLHDFYEAYTAIFDEEDIWGNHLSDTERYITVIGALLPFVGSKLVREIAGPVIDQIATVSKRELRELANYVSAAK